MFVVTDIQACEPEALAHVPGIYITYEGTDSMGLPSVSVYGATEKEVVDYIHDQWDGDVDPEWFQGYIVDRVEEISATNIVPDLAAGADHSGRPTPGEGFVLRMVDEAWYYLCKGELNWEEDEQLRELLLSLYRASREFVDLVAEEQYTVREPGRVIEKVDTEEIALRVATSLSFLYWGRS